MNFINIHTHFLPLQKETGEFFLYNLPSQDKEKAEILANTHPEGILFSSGIHPGEEMDEGAEEKSLAYLEMLAAEKKISAIGECGLDRNSPISGKRQTLRFQNQILLSEKYFLPLILHCVHSWEEVFKLRKEMKTSMPWIAHSFRGSPELAADLEKKGFYISFSPVFLKKSERVKDFDFLSRFFLETDEAPENIQYFYELLGAKWELDKNELAGKIRASFKEVFHEKE